MDRDAAASEGERHAEGRPEHVIQIEAVNENYTRRKTRGLPVILMPLGESGMSKRRPRTPDANLPLDTREVLVDSITIGARFRKDPGDVQAFADSMAHVGLLHPVPITPGGQLIAGRRRLAAAKLLGWKTVPVRVVDVDDLLQAEHDENAVRKDFTPSEAVAIRRELKEHERALSRANQAKAGHKGKGASGKIPEALKADTRDRLAAGLPMSGKTLEAAEEVVKAAEQEPEKFEAIKQEMDRTGKVWPALQKVRAARALEAAADGAIAPEGNEGGTKYYTVPPWRALTAEQQRALIAAGLVCKRCRLNRQTTDAIGWALFSWNPISGCLHGCSYCWARDFANQKYPRDLGFAPALWPERLGAPYHQKVPAKAATNVAETNIFVAGMGDMWGRWVPREWIEAVLHVVRDCPQWNFLFLTKFPQRYKEFSPFPKNAWMGTTVDFQVRLDWAEKAMGAIEAEVKWLSVEPMLEPLTFKHLDLFQWVVCGGASASKATDGSPATPEWRVPVEWWGPLHMQAVKLGLKIFHKTNLFGPESGFPGDGKERVTKAPAVFDYLKKKAADEIKLGETA